MAMRLGPITAQLGKLSLGSPFSTTSIQMVSMAKKRRLLEHKRLAEEKLKREGPKPKPTFEHKVKPGHGEKIFIFHHFMDGMTVYSPDPVIKAMRALRQLPFVGKKMKPSKIRKDYWRPLAMIQFPVGQSAVGLSVYHLLRECKMLHAYSWDNSLLFGETKRTLTRRERGMRLNDQRANTIADLAAVLNGLGKGNRIVYNKDPQNESANAAQQEEPPELVTLEDGRRLFPATVWWADALERNYAKSWSANVTHHLFDEATFVPTEEKIARDLKDIEGEESQKGTAEVVKA